MRVLGLDSGAEHMGYASVGREDGKPYYHMSGIIDFPKLPDQTFQQYRLDLTRFYITVDDLFALTEPDYIASEILPPMGMNSNVQGYLANVAITVVHTRAIQLGIPVEQVAANSVKKAIGLPPRKAKKITKVHVREGCIQILPELARKRKNWIKDKRKDEPDAIAIGLTSLGFKVNKI